MSAMDDERAMARLDGERASAVSEDAARNDALQASDGCDVSTPTAQAAVCSEDAGATTCPEGAICNDVTQAGAGCDVAAAVAARLQAREIAYAYPQNAQVLRRVSADVVPGSFLAVLGTNGSGKSTLLNALDGMLTPQTGKVLLDGRSLASFARDERARLVAYVTQHSHANELTVYDALLLGRKPYVRMAPTERDYAKVDEVIERLSLHELALRNVRELSGGEYQKMIIARAFVQDADILLLDEPTNNLDMANQAEVLQLVRDAVDERGLAAVAVMHDVNLALRYCDRFLVMRAGCVLRYGGPEVINRESVLEAFGVEVDIIEHAGRRLVVPR